MLLEEELWVGQNPNPQCPPWRQEESQLQAQLVPLDLVGQAGKDQLLLPHTELVFPSLWQRADVLKSECQDVPTAGLVED